MKTNVMVAVVAAAALCGCHASQEGTTASVGGNDNGGSPLTVVGCLVPGAAGSQSGTVGTSGNTAESGFTLIDATTTSTPTGADTNAAPNSPATPATPGTSGTAGTSAAPGTPPTSGTASVDTGTPKSYTLIANKNEKDLQKYENSQVEVRGMLVASTDTGTGVPDVGAASTPAGTPPTNVQHVRVDHVRQLDKTCNGGAEKR
jgi:hypothetical protein